MSDLLPGRAADLAAIHRFADTAIVAGGALLILGQPGVGKSVLLDAAARYASVAGARIVRTAGTEFAAAVDYQALDQLLVPLHQEIELLPASSRDVLRAALGLTGGAVPGLLRVSHATLELLRLTGARRPLLVLVDSGQDLDEKSARVLAFAARRLSGSQVAMVLASRSDWASGVLERAGLPEHWIHPLDVAAAVELLGRRHPGLAANVRDRLVAEGNGNPQALLEYTAALTGRQRAGIEPLPPLLPISERVRALTGLALSVLPVVTRDVLLLAAVDETGDLTAVRAAAPEQDVLAALAPVVTLGFIHVDERTRRIAFAHPMLRAAVIRHAADLEIRRAHRALAAAWEHERERRIRHLAGAAGGTDTVLAGQLRSSAEAAIRRGDAAAALDALTRAADLTDDPAAHARLLAEVAILRADLTGESRAAARLIGRAGTVGFELAGSLPLAMTASAVALDSDITVDQAHHQLVAAVEAYGRNADADDATLIGVLFQLLICCWYSATSAKWEPFERALRRLRPGVPVNLRICAAALGDPARMTARLLSDLDAAVEELRGTDDLMSITRVAQACVYTDRLAACRPALARVLRDGRSGATAPAMTAVVSVCHELWQSGRWNELTELATHGIVSSERYGHHRYRAVLAGFHLAMVGVARGDAESGLAAAAELATSMSARGERMGEHFAHHVRALAAMGREDHAEAYREAAAISPAGTLGPYTPHALWVLLELVEGAVGAGLPDAARAHVDAMTEAGLARISPRLALVVAGCAAMVAAPDEAGNEYERALAVPGTERWPFDLARIHLAYGRLLRRRRKIPQAAAQLTSALERFRRLDARPWIRQAARELRAEGLPTATAGDNGPALSPQEQRIAELAATGLSNKQIGELLRLSSRTVGNHLYRAFPKLGISTRAALRDALGDISRGRTGEAPG